MNLDEVAARYHALEETDKGSFQRRARILQSMWREERGYPMGEHRTRDRVRPLGSRLAMPWAEETLSNYLTENVREVVRQEVLDPNKSRGKLYGRPRIFNDLLSSQPMAFNIFGELKQDLPLATSVLGTMTDGRIAEVTGIEFEFSPGRGDERYTGDRSAFDVYLTYVTPSGRTGFVGIEVKYHENLQGKAARHRDRYDEVAAAMGCFRQEALPLLKIQPLQQIWRDHLLAGSLLTSGAFDDGFFVFLHPERNQYCGQAVQKYMECLSESRSFNHWTIEDLCSSVKSHTQKEWITIFVDRYFGFEKIDTALLKNT